MNVNHIERREPRVNFQLQKMEVIYDKAKGQSDIPHRHDYYTVLLVESAKGMHIVDFNEHAISDSELHFVSPGQVHQVNLSEKPKGWVITFSKDFLAENNIKESFITNINLFQPFDNSPPLKINKETRVKLKHILDEISTCLNDSLKYKSRALGALLQLFLIYSNNSKTVNDRQLDEDTAEICILRDFKSLVEQKYRKWHQVQNYASEINITPKHLSQTVKNVTGKVAKEYIQDRLVLESKRLLLHTDQAIKEIAYEIGFKEPLHFSNFFKKQTGVSPSDFRSRRSE